MLKRVFTGILLVLLLGVGLAFRFGGGGPAMYYFPGGTVFGDLKNINVPILNIETFESGIIVFGGYGYGGVPGMMYSGGFGFGGEREYTTDSGVYKVTIGGGFGSGLKRFNFGNVTLNAGLGIGGIDLSIEKKVNEGNTNLSNLQNGNIEGYLGATINYFAVSAELSLGIQVSFVELQVGVLGFAGYSVDGWTVNNKPLGGLTQDYKFLLNYALYGGVGFGF